MFTMAGKLTMSADINSYRCRVGQSNHGTGGMCIGLNFSLLIRIIGAVSFIRILLVMAGIEQNPGPQDQYVFRYQYLLIEIGGKVLREIFEVQVGRDFMNYLATNTTASRTLHYLITSKNRKITPDQEKLLPPMEKNPTSSAYDITLLSLLLRNICGLCPAGDQVWMNPLPTDHRVEADITRLRKCRNEVMYIDTLRISEKELNDKWQELEHILNRLNITAGLANLSKMINDAKHMDIDVELKGRYIETIKAWVTMDCSLDKISGLKRYHSELDTRLGAGGAVEQQAKRQHSDDLKEQEDISELRQGLSKLDTREGAVEKMQQHAERQHSVSFKDIKEKLVDLYQRAFSTLPVSPLLMEFDAESLYEFPTLRHVYYHVPKVKMENESVTSYHDVFYDKEHAFRNIFVTGDAGVGKTTFCKRMCLLWSKSQEGGVIECEKKGIECLAHFDFMFYLSLGDSDRRDVIAIIVDQLFDTESHADWEMMYALVENLVRDYNCLIILDGLDEWNPRRHERYPTLPSRIMYEKCIYLTTSRPYKIENMRLKTSDIDHQIQITGLHGNAWKSYVVSIVTHLNKANHMNKHPEEFLRELKEFGFEENFCIPMIVSQLVSLWFETKLTDMSIALIYGTIVDKLFEAAERKGVEFPPSCCGLQYVPDSLSNLHHFAKHASLMQKVCLLSFRSLFKLDETAASLVFTSEQVLSEPYCCSQKEIDLLCKIGILSKNKVVGQFLTRKLMLSFIVHKGFIEFFAALFVLKNKDDIIAKWPSISDVVQFQNFFLFLTEFSSERIQSLFENMYCSLWDELALYRKKLIFPYNGRSSEMSSNQIMSLQNTVINCFKQSFKQSCNSQFSIRHEDFIFDYNSDVAILSQLLMLNATRVKSLVVVEGNYYDVFDEIKNLQILRFDEVLSENYVKFTKCMLINQSTLHTVCIDGGFTFPLLPALPVRSLHQLTSLSLYCVTMKHEDLNDLMNYLSHNFLVQNIALCNVFCNEHRMSGACTSLNLSHHVHLESLCLKGVNTVCKYLDTSSLKSIALRQPFSKSIVVGYIDIFNLMKYSQLEHMYVDGCDMLDDEAVRTLTTALKSLPCIQSVHLGSMLFPDDVMLELHDEVEQVKIELYQAIMSRQCFRCFIESCVNKQSVIKVKLMWCQISAVDGDTHRKLSEVESVNYMSEFLSSIPKVNIMHKDDYKLHFETTSW